MDGLVKSLKQNNKRSPHVKKAIGTRKGPALNDEAEGLVKCSEKLDKRFARTKVSSRKSPNKQSQLAWTSSARDISPNYTTKEFDRVSDGSGKSEDKGCAKAAGDLPARKAKEERRHPNQNSTARASAQKLKSSLATARSRTKSVSPSHRKTTQGKRMKISFDQKEWALRHNKYGRAADAFSPKGFHAGGTTRASKKAENAESQSESGFTSDSVRPLCTPNHVHSSFSSLCKLSNESSAVYPLESLESMATISDRIFVSDSFPASSGTDYSQDTSFVDIQDSDILHKDEPKELKEGMVEQKLLARVRRKDGSPFPSNSRAVPEINGHDVLDVPNVDNLRKGSNHSGNELGECLNISEKEVKNHPITALHATDDLINATKERCGYPRVRPEKKYVSRSSEEHHCSLPSTRERCHLVRKVNSINGEGISLDEEHTEEKPFRVHGRSQSSKDSVQKRKGTELYKVHVHAQNIQPTRIISPKFKTSMKSAKDISRSNGGDVALKNRQCIFSSRSAGRDSVSKARSSLRPEAQTDTAKDTCANYSTCRTTDLHKYAPRSSPRQFVASKQKQFTSSTTPNSKSKPNHTQGFVESKINTAVKSRSYLVSDKNSSDKATKSNKVTSLDQPRESQKTSSQKHGQGPRSTLFRGRDKAYEINAGDCFKDKSSPEKKTRFVSKFVAPNKFQTDVSSKAQLQSAPNRSEPVSHKPAGQRLNQNKISSSASVVKMRNSRGDGHYDKRNSGAALVITPLYGSFQSASAPRCGPKFIDNISQVIELGNESCNKSTASIMDRANMQLQKIQAMKCKRNTANPRLSMLKSKSMLNQVHEMEIAKAKRARSVEPRASRASGNGSNEDILEVPRSPIVLKTVPTFKRKASPSVWESRRVENHRKLNCALSQLKDHSSCYFTRLMDTTKESVAAPVALSHSVHISHCALGMKCRSPVNAANYNRYAQNGVLPLREDALQHTALHKELAKQKVGTARFQKRGCSVGIQSGALTLSAKIMDKKLTALSSILESGNVTKSFAPSAYRHLLSNIISGGPEAFDIMEEQINDAIETKENPAKCFDETKLFCLANTSPPFKNDEADSGGDERPSPMLKRYRRATASLAEINLLATNLDSLSGNEADNIVNVRKIDFEPMICIPLADSESLPKANHPDTGTDCQIFFSKNLSTKYSPTALKDPSSDKGIFSSPTIANEINFQRLQMSEELLGSQTVQKFDPEIAQMRVDNLGEMAVVNQEMIDEVTPGYLVPITGDKDASECDTVGEMIQFVQYNIGDCGSSHLQSNLHFEENTMNDTLSENKSNTRPLGNCMMRDDEDMRSNDNSPLGVLPVALRSATSLNSVRSSVDDFTLIAVDADVVRYSIVGAEQQAEEGLLMTSDQSPAVVANNFLVANAGSPGAPDNVTKPHGKLDDASMHSLNSPFGVIDHTSPVSATVMPCRHAGRGYEMRDDTSQESLVSYLCSQIPSASANLDRTSNHHLHDMLEGDKNSSTRPSSRDAVEKGNFPSPLFASSNSCFQSEVPLCDQLITPSYETFKAGDKGWVDVSELQQLYESLSSDGGKIVRKDPKSKVESEKSRSNATGKRNPLGTAITGESSPSLVEVTFSSMASRPPSLVESQVSHPSNRRSRVSGGTSRMDLSTDSFNSLFIENAMYLQGVTAERKNEDGCNKIGAQRKLKVKKLSFLKKSKEEEKKKSNPRLLSSVQPNKTAETASDSQATTTGPGAQPTLDQQGTYFEGQFSPSTLSPTLQESESPTLCLSDLTGCNVTRSSITECLKSRGRARLTLRDQLKIGQDEFAGSSDKPHQLRVSESGSPKKGIIEGSESPLKKWINLCTNKPSSRSLEPDGRVGVTNEGLDPLAVRSKVDEMEARRRRRFLERASEVTSDDSKSWRSRIYQKDNADELSSNRGEKTEARRTEPSNQNEDSDRGSFRRRRGGDESTSSELAERLARRRGGDESTSSELAERLARRRAQRLEDQGESSSIDGSVEGGRLSSRRWSRDGSIRSIESSESGDADTGFTSRRARRSDGDSGFVNNNSSAKETLHDSRSEDGYENIETTHVTLGWHSRQRETGDAHSSHWDSRDSANGVSLSSDAGDAYVMGKLEAHHRSGDSGSFEESSSLFRKGRSLQRTSKDSAFSESVENGNDLKTNVNNSNNNSSTQDVFLRESPSSSFTYRARRIQEYIQDCEKTGAVLNDKPPIPNGIHAHSDGQTAASNIGRASSPSREHGHPTVAMGAPRGRDDEESSLNENVERENRESGDGALASFKARLLRLRGVEEADDTKKGGADTNSSVEAEAHFNTMTTQDELLPDTRNGEQLWHFSDGTGNVDNNAEVPADAPPEVERTARRRVDKSAMRKSPLNMSTESSDMAEETQHPDSHQEDGGPRRRAEGSVVSQHASFWENPSSQHAPAPARARANIPTRYMGDLSAKISATRQKFNQASTEPDKSTTASVSRSKVDAIAADVHLKTKKVDLGQLIQKFSSGSESNSEKSDTDADPQGSVGHRPFVRRQKAEEIHSSSEESESARRTPERTQSLKAYTNQVSGVTGKVEKSSSFRSEFMNRRLAQKTSGSINDVGQSKEATPPPKEATPPPKETTPPPKEATPPPKEASALSKDSTNFKTLASSLNSESKSKSLSEVSTEKLEKPRVAHSQSDQRTTFSSISKTQEPSVTSISDTRRSAYSYDRRTGPATVSPEKDSLISSSPSTDPKLTDYELSSLKNRAWLSSMSSRRIASGASTNVADKAKEDTATQSVTLPSTHKSFNDQASTGSPTDQSQTPGMTTLDKSLELLSKVTEELDHPERPSSLSTSPLDLKSPGAKAKSPSFEEAHKYIQDVQTSIRTISSRGSPEKTKSPGSAQASFTFQLPEQAKVPEPERPASRRAARDLKSLEREVEAGARPTDSRRTHVQHDPKSTERDSKSAEPDTKSTERAADNCAEDKRTLTTTASRSQSSERETKVAPPAQEQVTPMSTAQNTSTQGSTDVSKAQPSMDLVPTPGSSLHTKPNVLHGPSTSSTDILSGMKRSSSFKDPSELNEKRKGILKRTTSLRNKDEPSSAPILDPQLAKILQQRKQIVEDVLEEEDERDRKRTLSATEEIQENLKYSKQKAAEQGKDPEEDEALRRLSVAERVQYMQTKMEEERYSAATSRSRSGMSTPRSRPVSELITPTQFKYDDPHQPHMSTSSSASSISALALGPGSGGVHLAAARSREDSVSSSSGSADARQPLPRSFSSAVSGPTLIEKLTVIAESGDAFQERRHRFQQRSRNDWRHQTQPVTLEEISAADSLEAVSAFRALVRKKTSINAFDQLRDQGATKPAPLGGKKAEFPQHLSPSPKSQRRGRRLRHRTLPVTAEELNAVPENQMLVMNPEWAKTEDVDDKRDSKADSGILSGSDLDLQYGGPGADPESGEPSKMTISARASFFRGLEEKSKAEQREKSASGAKRYIMRKKRERSQTMPVTDDELMNASEMGEKSSGTGASAAPESSRAAQSESRSRSASISEDGEGQHEEDELTKLSISEKVKLFSQQRDKEQQPPPKAEVPVKRRGRKQPSRFSTQPVTSEEVEQAAAHSRISPLAMSLVKPPDPDILKGLPLKDQRQLMAQHAEMFLSQSSLRSRSGSNASVSQPSSRRASVTLEEDKRPESGEEEKSDRRGILKDKSASTKELHEIKGILRSEPVKVLSEPEVHSILKGSWESHHPASAEPRGILKKAKSEDIPTPDSLEDSRRHLFRHVDSDDEDKPGKPRSRSNSQPFSILKRDPSPQPDDHEIKGILKTPSHENVPHLISAMRRGSNESDSLSVGHGALKSALRHRGHNPESEEGHHEITHPAQELKSALHKPHAPSAGDKMDDVNSHIHVDLTLAISDIDDEGRSTYRQPHSRSPGSSSAPHASNWSSLDRGDEGRPPGSGAAASSLSSFSSHMAPEEKSTLQVPEDECKTGASASEGEGESSAGELLDEPRTNRLRKKSRMNRDTNSERYKTQPPELADGSASSASEPTKRKYKYEARHKTQPITHGEMREAEAAAPATNLIRTPGGSISDRLNQLKTSGNEEWKKRVERKDDIMTAPEVVKLREQSSMRIPRPTSIADRLSELEVSKKTWQNRVEESDAKQFTVAAKLANNVVDSPLVNKLKSLPKKEGDGISPVSSPVTPTKEFIAKIPLPKDIVHDPLAKIEPIKRESESEDKKEPVKVEVPDVGEEMQAFFNVKSISEIQDKVEMTIDDLNDIFIEAENILPSVHKIKPQRKQKPSTHNPLKYMKVETVNEYHEVTLGTAEKELRRVKREGLAKDAGFAEAALAGLASKENFKQVELRRTDSGSTAHGVALEPFKDLMLFHVKGRRTVQTRLVEPHTRSVNSGDSYLLVTPEKVIHWEGQYANVIEKAKANEIAACIQTKKEMGCKRANEVIMVYQSKDHYGNGKQFWSSLEGEKQCQDCGPDNEDELYEASIVKSNMIYRLEGNALLPYTEYWGDLPKYEMLQKNEVIVFDFGSEFYLWQGKSVGMEQRKLGLKLAKQLFEKGYDYTESAINPLSPLRTEEHGGLPVKADKRPSWVIFGKVNQNMETILFREKFADWPDTSRIIGVKALDPTGAENNSKDQQELKPYDAALMLPLNTGPVTLKLEGSDLGRGVKWAEDMQGFVKEQEIITINVTTWHVLEYEHSKLPLTSHGQFHDGDTYVVRWQYMIASANLRNVKGLLKNIPKGRERCAYFFWQGSNSTINEKGASALMTVELDEERGPQVRVLQGKEIPCFLNLFNGKMVVHIGKREDSTTCTQGSWRLYCLRGDYENEACLVEIPVAINHLRSKSSLVLLNVNTGIVYIWHGAKSPKHIREIVRKTVEKIQESPPLEFSLHKSAVLTITEVEEGEEKKEIWAALDSRDREIYHSLLKEPRPYTHTIRMFHMSSVNMVFEVHEQLNPSRVPDLTTPYPFLQSDLYKATQPALFLLDNEHEVFLWQGWFPVSSQDTDNVITGSAKARFNMDRICAMETTLHYCKVKNAAHPPTAYLVCAGVEPECFTALFPVWMVDTVVQELSLEEGKTQGYKEKVSEVLHRLTKTKYTLAELQERPLPEGVDPLKLESYLEDEEFQEILGMNREEFYGNPIWKQKQLKQHAKLF